MADNDYFSSLPDDSEIQEGLSYVHDLWRDRNEFIGKIREMLDGRNKIEAPSNTPYKIRTLHSYALAAIVNEKAARFTQLPQIQVVPFDESREARVKSSRLEIGVNAAFSEMERLSDGDVWTRAVVDAIIVDEGVERIERAPAAFWPEIVQIDDNGDVFLPNEQGPFDKELTIQQKKARGLPIRSIYVPLENFFPIYEGPTLVESYEVELRSLRDVLRNPLFKGSERLNDYPKDSKQGLRTQVSIIHYVNHVWHAYYAMAPNTTTRETSGMLWPDYTSTDLATAGQPVFLYGYKHNLGESLYNTISGRFGGWKTSHNRIEGVGKGLLELGQATDELVSQVTTNVRAKYWPTMLQEFDIEARGIDPGATPPSINIQEGQNYAIYKGENVRPLFEAKDDPMVAWLFDKIQDQLGRLGGSPAVFGQNIPGVETGYQQSLQITQAEHLDEKIEQHLSIGASNRAKKILKHVKVMNLGDVYVHHIDTTKQGKKKGDYYTISPDDLTPLPRMDASVRRPRPVDFAANIRAAREATDDRGGRGPLMSDDSVRSDILSMTAPDVEEHKIRVERQLFKMWESGIIDMKIMEALNIKLATTGIPQGDNTGGASPAALEASRQMLNGQAGPVGIQGDTPVDMPLTPGQPVGSSQPEANAGKEIAGALF